MFVWNGRARIMYTATNSQFMAKVDLLDVIAKMTNYVLAQLDLSDTGSTENFSTMYNVIMVTFTTIKLKWATK